MRFSQFSPRRESRSEINFDIRRASFIFFVALFLACPIRPTRRAPSHSYPHCGVYRPSIKIQRHVQGEGRRYTYQSCRSHASVEVGCNRLACHSILMLWLSGSITCYAHRCTRMLRTLGMHHRCCEPSVTTSPNATATKPVSYTHLTLPTNREV